MGGSNGNDAVVSPWLFESATRIHPISSDPAPDAREQSQIGA